MRSLPTHDAGSTCQRYDSAATLWLHFAKGNSGANAYGPPPVSTGFSPPPPGQRRVAGAATRSGASPAITA